MEMRKVMAVSDNTMNRRQHGFTINFIKTTLGAFYKKLRESVSFNPMFSSLAV